MQDRDAKLKPCPFCGGKGWLRGHPLGIQIVCPVCDGKGCVELTNEENKEPKVASKQRVSNE